MQARWVRWGLLAGAVGAGCSSRGAILTTDSHVSARDGGTGGSSNGGSAAGHSGGNGTSGGGTPADGTGGGGIGFLTGGSSGSQSDFPDAGECATFFTTAAAETVLTSNLDLFILLDQSSSMGEVVGDAGTTRWTGTTNGIAAFLNAPPIRDVGAAIQYFPLDGLAPASCTADYATPAIDIGTIPENAGDIIGTFAAHTPNDFTPTGPALTGAIQHMKAWATAHPARHAAVVLMTDGYPTECDPLAIADIAAVAKAAATAVPPVLTFVIGLDPSATDLDQIASAGGTNHAYSTSGTAGEVQRALAQIALPQQAPVCSFLIPAFPSGYRFDRSLVNVYLRDATSGERESIYLVTGSAECAGVGGGGWYYDDSDAGTSIELCPTACAATETKSVNIVFGCPTLGPPV